MVLGSMLRCAEQTWCELWAAKEFQMMASWCIHHPPPLIHSISPSKETFRPSPIFSKTLICRTLFVPSLFGDQIFTNAINFFPCFVHHPIDCHPPQSIPLHLNISETKAIAHGLNIYVYLWALGHSRDSCKDYPISSQGMFFSDDTRQEKTVNLCQIRDKDDKDHNNTNTMTS